MRQHYRLVALGCLVLRFNDWYSLGTGGVSPELRPWLGPTSGKTGQKWGTP